MYTWIILLLSCPFSPAIVLEDCLQTILQGMALVINTAMAHTFASHISLISCVEQRNALHQCCDEAFRDAGWSDDRQSCNSASLTRKLETKTPWTTVPASSCAPTRLAMPSLYAYKISNLRLNELCTLDCLFENLVVCLFFITSMGVP
jgi:hypothetical protein